MDPGQVMVLGATGLVGRHVLSELVAAGHHVVAVARNPPGASRKSVDWVRADVTRERDIERMPHCALAVATLDIRLTADLAPKLAARGLRRMVAFSSTSAETKAAATDEGERQLAEGLVTGERRVMALSPAVRSTILRPTMIYGARGDSNVERIADHLLRFRVFPLIGGGAGLRQPVHAEDLGVAAVRALFSSRAEDKMYTLAGGEVLTVRSMVSRVGETNGVRARFIKVPLQPTQRALQAMGRLWKFRTVPAGALERMTKDLAFDNSPASDDFGYSPREFEPPDYRQAQVNGGGSPRRDSRYGVDR